MNPRRLVHFFLLLVACFHLLGVQQCTDEDMDGDGWTVEDGDCDDTNPFAHPGAGEVCDLADNDCDGEVDESLEDCDLTGICTDPSGSIDEYSFDCVDNSEVFTEENVRPQAFVFCFYDESVLVANKDVQIQGYNFWVEQINTGAEDEVSLFVWEGYLTSSELTEGWYGTTIQVTDVFRLDVVTPQEPEKFDSLFATGFVQVQDVGEGILEPVTIADDFEVQWGQGGSKQDCVEHLQDF